MQGEIGIETSGDREIGTGERLAESLELLEEPLLDCRDWDSVF